MTKAGSAITLQVDPGQAKRIMKMYDTLGTRLTNKIIKRETRPFSKKITEAAKANAPAKTGKLRKSIKTRVAKNEKGRMKVIGTATYTGDGFFKGDTYYGGFQEFGFHLARRPGKGQVDNRRFIEGKFYMKKAADDQGPAALRGAADAIARALDAEAKQLSRGVGK